MQIFQDASCYKNRDKLWPDGPLGSYADFTFNKHGQFNLRLHVMKRITYRNLNIHVADLHYAVTVRFFSNFIGAKYVEKLNVVWVHINGL